LLVGLGLVHMGHLLGMSSRGGGGGAGAIS